MAIFFPESEPAAITALVAGLVNIGATAGATYGSDALNNSAAQMPTLVVPPDKDDEATFDTLAANSIRTNCPTGSTTRRTSQTTWDFIYPLFSNVGLLGALANLNPLVLDASRECNDTLGSNNPTAAAVNNAAWKTLLPSYFKWVPVDPTTESQSQNFDNFYPGATPAAAGDAANQLEALAARGRKNPYQYPGFNDAGQITTNLITFPGPDSPDKRWPSFRPIALPAGRLIIPSGSSPCWRPI